MSYKAYTIIIGLIIAIIFPSYSQAQETEADTVTRSKIIIEPSERFQAKNLIVPGALVAVGAFGVNNGWFCGIKDDLRGELNKWRGDRYCHIDDWCQYVPVGVYAGLGFIPGVKKNHDFVNRLMGGATAYIIMTAVVNATKYTVKEKRPDSNARNSFPSGHTATAFVGAELIRLEYGNAIGAGAYAFATGIAFLRLYNERHWLNDVLAGAGIGILSAQAAYWLLPYERKLFGLKNTVSHSLTVIPSYSPYDRTLCLSGAIVF